MIDNALLDQSEVVIKGDPVRAKWVAHQIALKHAAEEHDLKRVITFHTSIRAAAAFASDDSEGVGIHLPQFQRFHVSGAQPTAERDEHMREFARVQRGVITNARCLTEGVDVPSVDMVAFMNPRRSRVDIVQAVGRAMRTSDYGKTCGYVLVPLFLELRQGETLNEAIERSDFDEIVQVLNAMRDNDAELSDIIQALNVDRGRTGGFDESRLRDKVEVLGPQIQLSELTASICTRLVNELAFTWDERYGQLIAYKQTHGNCNVPQVWNENPALGTWCSHQRSMYKSNKLSQDRIRSLEQIGFVWVLLDAVWDEMFAALVAYKQLHGDCNVPQGWKDNPALGNWCTTRRHDYKRNIISPDRIKSLEQLGFVWESQAIAWEGMFATLAIYKQTHGDCNVRRGWKDDPALGRWCSKQRARYRKNNLPTDRILRLEDLGFVWHPVEATWETMFADLVAYKQTYGNCNVPDRWKNNPELGTWCKEQRTNYKRKNLSPDRVNRLNKLGIVWHPFAVAWEQMFGKLFAYKQTHGDCNVPQAWKDDPELGTWCNSQRTKYKRDKLRPERITRLEQLGFVWDPFAAAWEEMFAALVDYKQTHGDCNVPVQWKEDPKLGSWCRKKRSAFQNNRLSGERIKRLEDIGFQFGVRELKRT